MKLVTKTIARVEHNLELRNRLLSALKASAFNGYISQVAYYIAANTDRLCAIESIFLCWTACRYSELHQITIPKLIDQKYFFIRQHKTSSTRRVRSIPLQFIPSFSGLDYHKYYSFLGPDSVARAILRSTPTWLSRELKGHRHSTHIFRHLRASFLNYKGFTLPEIRDYFGHATIDTTKEYIHGPLIKYFSQTH